MAGLDASTVYQMFAGFNQDDIEEKNALRELKFKQRELEIKEAEEKRLKKRDKVTNDQTLEAIKASEQLRELQRYQKQQIMLQQWQSMRAQIQKTMIEARDNERKQKQTASINMFKVLESTRAGYKPGQSDSPEATMLNQTALGLMLESSGMDVDKINELRSGISIYTEPEETASLSQRVQAGLQLIEGSPEVAVPMLEKSLDLTFPEDAIEKLKADKDLSRKQEIIEQVQARGGFESPEDYQTALRNAVAGTLGIFTGSNVKKPSAGVSAQSMDLISVALEREFKSKEEADMMASYMTIVSKEMGDGRTYKTTTISKWMGDDMYKIEEDTSAPKSPANQSAGSTPEEAPDWK